jgi:mannose-1-phosphate guanylyltransferase/mannose-6-phosphate isomerase
MMGPCRTSDLNPIGRDGLSIRPVILAGGSGTRLWPASRRLHPKQLLALTGSKSFLQETATRLRGLQDIEVLEPIVVTNEEYRFLVVNQLREVGVTAPQMILEPVGRNTAPALTVAALARIDSDDDPVLLTMPSDHVIENVPAFHAAVVEGATQAEKGMLVTFGIVPERPETGYGYIRVGQAVPGAKTARALVGFEEKPDLETAQLYMAKGDRLWNSGLFMMKRSVWLAAIERYRPQIATACRQTIRRAKTDGLLLRLDRSAFSKCQSESIDYAVMEELDSSFAAQAVVVPLDAGWSDVGSWEAIWSISPRDEAGNATSGEVVVSEDTRGTFVHADSRLVAVLGGADLVVIETADAVLVADRAKTADLKKIVAHVQQLEPQLTETPRRVYRPWGRFESIHSGERFQVKNIVVDPGASMSLQFHKQRAEHWIVVRGVAEVTCGDRVFRLTADESTYVPLGSPHRLANPGTEPLEIIEVQSGEYLGEDDIVRLDDLYGRVDEEEGD